MNHRARRGTSRTQGRQGRALRHWGNPRTSLRTIVSVNWCFDALRPVCGVRRRRMSLSPSCPRVKLRLPASSEKVTIRAGPDCWRLAVLMAVSIGAFSPQRLLHSGSLGPESQPSVFPVQSMTGYSSPRSRSGGPPSPGCCCNLLAILIHTELLSNSSWAKPRTLRARV